MSASIGGHRPTEIATKREVAQMRTDSITKCLSLCQVGLAVLFGISATCGIAEAQSGPNNLCCNPAHATTPVAPAGSGTSCVWDPNQQQCVNKQGGTCSGFVSQSAVVGQCPANPTTSCTANTQITGVICLFGSWQCTGTANGCTCQWVQVIPAQWQTLNMNDCSGSTCP